MKNIKHAMISLIFSLLLTLGTVLFVLLFIKNADLIIQIFSDYDLTIKIITEQSNKKITFPYPVVFSVLVIFFAIFYFLSKKNKFVFVLLVILFTFISIVSILIFTKLDSDFIFELIDKSLKFLT